MKREEDAEGKDEWERNSLGLHLVAQKTETGLSSSVEKERHSH